MSSKHLAQIKGFSCAAAYNRYVEEQWNAAVSRDDTTYVLGDFSECGRKSLALTQARRLNGAKVFLQGERDPLGWGVRVLNLKTSNDRLIILSHFPFEVWERSEFKSFHLHGHRPASKIMTASRRGCVHAETLGYRPALLRDVLDACDDRPEGVRNW